MAAIIRLDLPERRKPLRSRPALEPGARGAQILFFTGVQRHPALPAPAPAERPSEAEQAPADVH